MIQGTNATHAVRNTQSEYKSRRRKSVKVSETMCGRHIEGTQKTGGIITCKSCKRAVKRAGAGRR